jgi:hypothetical protein
LLIDAIFSISNFYEKALQIDLKLGINYPLKYIPAYEQGQKFSVVIEEEKDVRYTRKTQMTSVNCQRRHHPIISFLLYLLPKKVISNYTTEH